MEKQNNVEVLKFDKNNIPVPYESKETNDNKYVSYGHNNLYPNFLLSLYNDSPIHSSIINSKATYIIGDGLKSVDGKDLDFKVNASDGIKEFADKVIKDYLIFNALAVEVVFNVFGEAVEYHHVPMHRVRTNKSKTKFWYNEDWFSSRKHIQYDRWSPRNSDSTSKIFFFDGYFPSVHAVYSQPEYNGSIKSIVTDISIREFNLNNIKNHFSVSSIITFFQGTNVSDENKRKVLNDLKASYTGETGKKVIVDFQNANGKSAEVKSLSSNDWSEAFEVLRKDVSDDIYRGHSVTSPMLMGVKTEGQLGGATELETAYEIFKNTYIRVKRDELESAFNMLFSTNKQIGGKVRFQDKPLFNTRLTETMKEKVMTINEIRKEAGLAAIPNGERLLSDSPQAQPSTETAPVEQAEDVKKKSTPETRKLTEEDYDRIKDMGTLAEEFEILSEFDDKERFEFDLQEDIAAYVLENDIRDLTLDELATLLKEDKGIKVTGKTLRDILGRLNESGVVKVDYKDGKVKVTPSTTADVPDSSKVSVMYAYEKRPGVAGPDLLRKSRSFCTKMINNKRLYTRSEIQQMSGLFGYDVYQYAGGFYYNPETEKLTPYCRHIWKAYSVKKKSQ
jgi:hypothetical protein